MKCKAKTVNGHKCTNNAIANGLCTTHLQKKYDLKNSDYKGADENGIQNLA